MKERELHNLNYIKEVLISLGTFYYWPNDGNLGDYLIAEATRQLFRKWQLCWKEYTPDNPPLESHYNLVYGGGGRFVKHWGGLDNLQKQLCKTQIAKCIILPHSIFKADDFVKALDTRHIVFCREKNTLNYCNNLNKKAKFLLSHDLGISLDFHKLPDLNNIPNLLPDSTIEAKNQYKLLKGIASINARIRMKLATAQIPHSNLKVTFLLRTDKEKNGNLTLATSYDLSLFYSASCRETIYSSLLVRFMGECLKKTDIIVTDRLHIAIMAMHLRKKTYMLDNDYGKLSGVYHYSLNSYKHVILLKPNDAWPRELQLTWKQLNTVKRLTIFKIYTKTYQFLVLCKSPKRLVKAILNKLHIK